ncbi:MAG: hypothetical protein JNN04_12875 [Cyclobacteriaceae bacterium]|nr:hypothetical protein [Cyclobacteriaceae bacterium]
MNEDIDSKIISTTLFWTYVLVGLLTEGLILWLFPFTGLSGLICWPTALFFSFAFAFVVLRIHKKLKRGRLTAACFAALLFFQFFIQLLLTPQEIGGEPIGQISEAISTYRRFDKIDFSDFAKLKQFERAAYIFKNKTSLPDSYLVLSIDSVNNEHLVPGDPDYFIKSTTFVIEVRDGKKNWNRKELGLIETDSSTIVIHRIGQVDSTVYTTINGLLRGGVGDSRNEGVSIFCAEDDLKLKTGMQEVFYGILGLTRKSGE